MSEPEWGEKRERLSCECMGEYQGRTKVCHTAYQKYAKACKAHNAHTITHNITTYFMSVDNATIVLWQQLKKVECTSWRFIINSYWLWSMHPYSEVEELCEALVCSNKTYLRMMMKRWKEGVSKDCQRTLNFDSIVFWRKGVEPYFAIPALLDCIYMARPSDPCIVGIKIKHTTVCWIQRVLTPSVL